MKQLQLIPLLVLLFTLTGKTKVIDNKEEEGIRDTLLVGVKHSPPFLMEGANGKIRKGVSHGLWVKLAERSDFEYRFERFESLSQLLQALEEGRIDVCINPLTVTSDRLQRVNFTQPFYISNLSIATRKKTGSQLLLFIRNFFSMEFLQTVLLLFLIIFIFGLMLWGVERRKNPDMFRKGWQGMMDGFWWSAVTMTTVGYGDKAPETGLGKLIATVWMFTAVIIVSGFTATIASSLTVQKTQKGVEGLQDLAKVRTASVQGSNSADFLEKRGIDPIEKPTLEAAVDALEKGKIEAVFYDRPLLRYAINEQGYKEDLVILNQKFEEQYYSYGLSKGAPNAEQLDQGLLKVLESENWNRILNRYDL